MYRSSGFRTDLTRTQARYVSKIRDSQRLVYNRAVERLRADPTLTGYGLNKEFTKLRRTTPRLRAVERICQNTAIHQSPRGMRRLQHGKGNPKFRSQRCDGTMAAACDVQPRFVDNMHASLPGIGVMRLHEEQPKYPHNRLYGSKPFRIADVMPKSWQRVKPGDRTYRLYVTYDVREPERLQTGTVAGTDRGITNPTVVCKTDHYASHVASYDTATALRASRSWSDAARRTVSRRSKHSRSTRRMKRQREKYNSGNANDREYAEWLLARKVCEGVDTVYIERPNLGAMTGRGGRRNKGLNRGMRFIRHGAMLRKIRIAAELLGIGVTEANPRGASPECSACGYTETTGKGRHSGAWSAGALTTPTATRR